LRGVEAKQKQGIKMTGVQNTAIHETDEVDQHYVFKVGDIGVRVQTSGLPVRVDARRQVFGISHGTSDDIVLNVRVGPVDSRSPGRLLFDSGMVWRSYDDHGEKVFRFTAPVHGSAPYKELRIDKDFRHGEIIINRSVDSGELIDPLEYPLDELVVVNKLGIGLGCELHACGVVGEDGRGWIFCGHSGAGKSTLARLLSGQNVTVLSDDRIIVRKVEGRVLLYGTPWHGEAGFAVATHAPLAGMLVLRHGTANRIEPMTRVEALSELMVRAFVPFYDEEAVDTALVTLNAALDEAARGRFSFVPDGSAVEEIRVWMEEVKHA